MAMAYENNSYFTNESSTAGLCFFLPPPDFHLMEERHLTNSVTALLNVLLMPIAIVANLLIMLAISRNSLLQTPSNVLLACLAFSDFLVGLIVQPCFVIFRVMENAIHTVPCSYRVVYSESFWVCYGVSFMMLSAISLERYIALRLHLRYKDVVTTRGILQATVVIWMIDMVLTVFQWVTFHVRNVQIALFLLCIVVTLSAHFKIFRILLRHQKQIQAQGAGASSRSYHRQTKLAVNVTYIVGLYLLCNMPVMIVQLCQFAMNLKFVSLNVYSWVETVAFLNSSLNPLVCCWRNKNIRRGIVRIIRRMKCNEKKRARSRSSVYTLGGENSANLPAEDARIAQNETPS